MSDMNSDLIDLCSAVAKSDKGTCDANVDICIRMPNATIHSTQRYLGSHHSPLCSGWWSGEGGNEGCQCGLVTDGPAYCRVPLSPPPPPLPTLLQRQPHTAGLPPQSSGWCFLPTGRAEDGGGGAEGMGRLLPFLKFFSSSRSFPPGGRREESGGQREEGGCRRVESGGPREERRG